MKAACDGFINYSPGVHTLFEWPQPGKQRRKIDHREYATRAEGAEKACVNRRRVGQVMVDTADDSSRWVLARGP